MKEKLEKPITFLLKKKFQSETLLKKFSINSMLILTKIVIDSDERLGKDQSYSLDSEKLKKNFLEESKELDEFARDYQLDKKGH